jgi:hypothetical protein
MLIKRGVGRYDFQIGIKHDQGLTNRPQNTVVNFQKRSYHIVVPRYLFIENCIGSRLAPGRNVNSIVLIHLHHECNRVNVVPDTDTGGTKSFFDV